ncbi:MAG: ABC transporter substrate-binding protein [candidate division NC10 bacterium]|nr:ABC transporter substrate-binding protein [candidate division NC10 bacterium]
MGSSETILIGALFPLSGRAAQLGRTGYQGARLAAEEINEAGGVLGGPIELRVADTRGPLGTVAEARAFVEQVRATALLGVVSSAAVLAVTDVARESKTVLMATIASTERATTEKFHRYFFRSGVSNAQESRSAARVAAALPHRRWYVIAPDYEYGYNSWTIFQAQLARFRPDMEVVGEAWPEFLEHDYGAYIEAILRAKPDAVYNLLYGGDLVAFTRQARGTTLFERIPFLNAEMSYNGLRFLAAGLARAGTRDSDALVQALEGMTLELPRGPVTLRTEDHQAILGMVWGRTRRDPDFAFSVLADLQVFEGAEITPPADEVLAARQRAA